MGSVPSSPTIPSHVSIPDNESSGTFVNCSDADIILRSCDSQEFRVLKLKQIQAIFDPPDPTGFNTVNTLVLPVLQMSDNGSILSSLLTFIFPVPPVLPPTFEEVMKLLSVAQKYEMESVLANIRGCIALQDPPFIHPKNAFRVYSLAQEYGLRQEAAKAARITLPLTLTIEHLEEEDMLDVMPGAHLHELLKYHQSVQHNLLSKIDGFISSAASGTLIGLTCTCTRSGIPGWLDDYIVSVAGAPSHFDVMELQIALAHHVKGSGGCASCANIPIKTIRTFWTALTDFINENIAKAESALTILGLERETCSQPHTCPPEAIPPLPECLSLSGADIVIQSSDHVNFPVHKSILAFSSPFFKDMFSLPQSSYEIVSGLPVLFVSEDAEVVRALITVLYPIPSEIPARYDRVLALLAASQKYDMPAAQFSIRAEVSHRKLGAQTGDEAFLAYVNASKHRLSPEMNAAAVRTLDYKLTFESLGNELQQFEGWALRDLVKFRKSRRDEIILCLESFLDSRSGPSKIWAGCPESKNKIGMDEPALPPWLHDLFTTHIEELKQNFTHVFMQPSSIRQEYLAALRSHTTTDDLDDDGCASCMKAHSHGGEEYCVELERKLAQARDMVSPDFFLSEFDLRTYCH
ncbi:hypothetical protein BJV74DRAFT_836933 [Russula compacta]|nr:hypothetical protein BJV74DRAFT_836933 [Russula compacta]